jgi:hypothetical protein
MTISTVYAYRDDGPMSRLTKWKPRRIVCTKTPDHKDLPGNMYVAKYASGRQGSACVISELVCTQLLAKLGLRTLKPFIVTVNSNFAASCTSKFDFPFSVSAGEHFGTLLETDVENGPPSSIDELKDPMELILLWVADTWVGNIDRQVIGNILLQHVGQDKFQIIAADQSDCFGGTSEFCSSDFPKNFLERGRAPAPRILPTAIAKYGGRTAITDAIAKVQTVATEVQAVISTVPSAWWRGAAIQPSLLKEALTARLLRLSSIINPAEWELPDGVLL